MEFETVYGTCRHCQQKVMVKMPKDINVHEDYADDLATQECTCAEARLERDKKKARADAYESINKLFNNYDSVKNILTAAVQPLITGKIENLTIKVNKETKATMKITTKGKIRVEKINVFGEVEEV